MSGRAPAARGGGDPFIWNAVHCRAPAGKERGRAGRRGRERPARSLHRSENRRDHDGRTERDPGMDRADCARMTWTSSARHRADSAPPARLRSRPLSRRSQRPRTTISDGTSRWHWHGSADPRSTRWSPRFASGGTRSSGGTRRQRSQSSARTRSIPLVRLLEVEDDPELRGFAAQALTRIGEPAIDRLREAVEAGGTLGAVAGLVLWQMEEPGIQALVGVCCPEDEAVRGGASGARAHGPDGFYRICREPGCSPRSWIVSRFRTRSRSGTTTWIGRRPARSWTCMR